MDLFKKSDFNELSEIHAASCLSIYIPTHQYNDEGEGMKKDQTMLKNQLKEAEKQLKILEHAQPEIDKFLKPIISLLDDIDFWKYQSHGLAFFYDNDKLRTYSLPHNFEPMTFVGNE